MSSPIRKTAPASSLPATTVSATSRSHVDPNQTQRDSDNSGGNNNKETDSSVSGAEQYSPPDSVNQYPSTNNATTAAPSSPLRVPTAVSASSRREDKTESCEEEEDNNHRYPPLQSSSTSVTPPLLEETFRLEDVEDEDEGKTSGGRIGNLSPSKIRVAVAGSCPLTALNSAALGQHQQTRSSPQVNNGSVGSVASNGTMTTVDDRPLLGNGGGGGDHWPLDMSNETSNRQPVPYGATDGSCPPPPPASSSPKAPPQPQHKHSNVPPPPLTLVDNTGKYPHTIAIVNPLSGERSAAEFVYMCLCEDLGAARVLKLNRETFHDPSPIVNLISQYAIRSDGERGTVVVSGGDGTVAFIMSQIDKLSQQRSLDRIQLQEWIGAMSPRAASEGGDRTLMPAVAVLALGTGNDFSNCMGFGNGYTKHKLCCMCVCCVNHVHVILDAVVNAPAATFDRWVATISPQNSVSSLQRRSIVFMNYFSLGMDAFIATNFDKLRKKFPSCFQYRFQNKGWYGGLGLYGAMKCDQLNGIVHKLTLLKDSAHVDPQGTSAPSALTGSAAMANPAVVTTVLPPKTKALVLSNVNSYSGGTTLWTPSSSGNKYCLTPTPSGVYINDKLLEVQALGGLIDMTMLQLKVGNGADKIAQAKQCEVLVGSGIAPLQHPIAIQSDGEPMGDITEPVRIDVRLLEQQIYVRCSNRSVIKIKK